MSEARWKFDKNSPLTGAVRIWRHELAERNRGGRARLRRCATPLEAVFEPAFHDLLRRIEEALALQEKQVSKDDRHALAALAALVARFPGDAKAGDEAPTPAAAGKKRPGVAARLGAPVEGTKDQPRLHPLRFRRLLDAKNVDELFPQLRRALAVIKEDVDLAGLGDALLHWNDDTRRCWAYDYYAAFSPKGAS
jgi:CRISPR system Cascade subunit CasB